jgi:Zn finger protein HypA/HybF involved in hydrogenase expression
MHEFGSVQHVIRELMKLEPVPKRVRVTIGKMRASPKGFEGMFRENVRDTKLQGVALEIVSVPVDINCKCGLKGPVRIMDHVHFVRCPRCGSIADIRTGRELDFEVLE